MQKKVPAKGGSACASTKKQAGGTVVSDLSKLAVPFGLVLLKDSLQNFLKKEKSKTAKSRPASARPRSAANKKTSGGACTKCTSGGGKRK